MFVMIVHHGLRGLDLGLLVIVDGIPGCCFYSVEPRMWILFANEVKSSTLTSMDTRTSTVHTLFYIYSARTFQEYQVVPRSAMKDLGNPFHSFIHSFIPLYVLYNPIKPPALPMDNKRGNYESRSTYISILQGFSSWIQSRQSRTTLEWNKLL